VREAAPVERDCRLVRLVQSPPQGNRLIELLQRLRQRHGRLAGAQGLPLGDGLLGGHPALVTRRRLAQLAEGDVVPTARRRPLQRPHLQTVRPGLLRDEGDAFTPARSVRTVDDRASAVEIKSGGLDINSLLLNEYVRVLPFGQYEGVSVTLAPADLLSQGFSGHERDNFD
jgi:hypothetical protein